MQNKQSLSCLTLALQNKKMEFVKFLLTVPDLDVNVKDAQGNSPLMTALKNDSLDIFVLLSTVETIDWNTTDGDGLTLEDVAR